MVPRHPVLCLAIMITIGCGRTIGRSFIMLSHHQVAQRRADPHASISGAA
jgi:hypothetical protein